MSAKLPTDGNDPKKPLIFLAFANDRDDTIGYLRNLPDEARRLRDALQPAERAGLCEVVVRSNCTAADIFKVFQDPVYRNRIAIFHYGGHANGYQLLLESADGESAAADAGGLAAFLAQQQGLQLVFLNGCSTQQQTEGLLQANISAVISTSRSIDDQVATDFSAQFYQGLSGGASLRTAYNEAAAAVQTSKGGNTRSLYFGNADDSSSSLEADRWPWDLYLRKGSEIVDQWNLPEAVNDPLFGLPPLAEQDLPESPYRHLDRFTRGDAEVFFGRGHQIRELYDRLTAPRSAPILLFYGQSGVGKSSILDAGLIPRLELDYEVRYLRRTEGGLLDTLRLAFIPEAAEEPIETAWRVKEEQTGKPLIVFLDQVEELYSRPLAELPNELDQLLEVVKATFVDSDRRPGGKLVLGFRKEWLAELESHLVSYELPRTKVFLEPLDRRGIIEVVQGPTRSERLRQRYGLTVEDQLAETIADDLLADRDSAIAPTLQILLTKLWSKATAENYEKPFFSQDLYQDLKRKGILLRDFLNQQIAAFRERFPEAVESGLLLDIVALHTTPLGTADQRSLEHLQEQYAHLGVTLPELLQQCQDLHLLTVAASVKKEGEKTTRLAHDTLAPLVREQFDVSDKPGQRARRILDNRSVDWADDREGTPLDEADLVIVEKGIAGTRTPSRTEQRLLGASRQLRSKLQRTRRILKATGVAAVAMITILGAFGWYSYTRAEAARKELGRTNMALDETNLELEKKKEEADKARDQAMQARTLADKNRSMARELMSDLVPELTQRTSLDKTELANESRKYFERFVADHMEEGDAAAIRADAKYAIGRIHLEMGKAEKAIDAYNEALALQQAELEKDPDNEALIRDLGYTQNSLGDAYKQNRDYKDAKTQFEAARDTRKKLSGRGIDDQLLFASSVMNIGLAEMKLGAFDSARKNFDEADNLRRELRDTLQVAKSEETDGKKVADIASIQRHLALGEKNRAVALYEQAKKSTDPTPADLNKEAETLVSSAIGRYESVLGKLPDDDFAIKAELANCYAQLGHLKRDQNLIGPAIEQYKQAKSGYESLIEERWWIAKYRRYLSDLSLAFRELDDLIIEEHAKEVREFLKSVRDFNTSQIERPAEKRVYLDYFWKSSKAYLNSLIKANEFDDARQQLEEDVSLLEQLREQLPDDSKEQSYVKEYLAELFYLTATACIGLEDSDGAKDAQRKSLELWESLIAEFPKDNFLKKRKQATQDLLPKPVAGD